MTDRSSDNLNGLDDPRYRIKTSQQMVASCTGALITSLMVTPFDVVKIRIQSQQKNQLSNKCFLYCNGLMDHLCPCFNSNGPSEPKSYSTNWYQRQSQFTGTIDAFTKISRSEGIGSLWSGLGPTLVLAVPATMVYFVTYEQLRLLVKDRHHGVQPMWGPLVSGATARLFAVTLVSPLELIRTKMQSKRVSYLEIGQAFKSLLYYHGPRGLFKGLGSTLLRDVPFSAIYWMHYEYFKSHIVKSTEPSFWLSFMAGAMAGSIAAVATNPFDVVKTHQQIELGEKRNLFRVSLVYSQPPLTVMLRKCKHESLQAPSFHVGVTVTHKNQPIETFNLGTMNFGTKLPGLVARFHLLVEEPPTKSTSSTRAVMERIYARHGLPGLFSGLVPRLVKVAPACAIMISTFEYGKLFFRRSESLGQPPTFMYLIGGEWRIHVEPDPKKIDPLPIPSQDPSAE